MADYEKMVRDIDELVETDFCFEMEGKLVSKTESYTQEEAKKMVVLLANIYSIAHSIHCKACRNKKYG